MILVATTALAAAKLSYCTVYNRRGNPYGGYSGGYKHSATGITNWKCIASIMYRLLCTEMILHRLMAEA